MSTPAHCRMMARYNRLANERIYEACAALSDEERKADRRAFFRSIHGTLNHIMVGDRVFHQKFGYGSIQDINGDKVTIAFEKAGTKKVIASFLERH